jgi:hypothetical protein
MFRAFTSLIIIFAVSFPAYSYVVQQNDTLANIVRKYYKVPPFGKNGGVAKLVELNKEVIKDPDHVPPGTVLRLNKNLLKDGVVDKNDGTQEDVETDEESEAASAEGLTPYIEVEKYDAAKPLKEKSNDQINVFAKFNTNEFDAENQATQSKFNFSSSSDVNVGIEYIKSLNDSLSLLGRLMLSHFASAENKTITPSIDASKKDQAAGSIGFRFLFEPDNYIDFLGHYAPHYYLKNNPATGNIILENNLSPSASVAMTKYFYSTKDASVGLDLGFEYITNTEDAGRGSTNSFAYFAGIIYRQNFRGGDSAAVEFSFKDSSLDTVDYKLRDHIFSLSFMYSLPY